MSSKMHGRLRLIPLNEFITECQEKRRQYKRELDSCKKLLPGTTFEHILISTFEDPHTQRESLIISYPIYEDSSSWRDFETQLNWSEGAPTPMDRTLYTATYSKQSHHLLRKSSS
mmetsp:Transcript_22537/g.22862  ORF Transcript_22537/g.22862 Transcript_22537/m.22862 type:complete len:115 (-) Transcript_22537:427-771(-)